MLIYVAAVVVVVADDDVDHSVVVFVMSRGVAGVCFFC